MPEVGLLDGVMCFVVVLVIGVLTIGGLKCLCVIIDWGDKRQKRKDLGYLSKRLVELEEDVYYPCDGSGEAADDSVASSLLLNVLKSRADHAVETSWYGGWEACTEWFDKGCPPCPDNL